jgi:alpha-soluble NSF attachment protein
VKSCARCHARTITNQPGNKHEEAAELLEKSANYFKLGKAWREATEAYRQLAAVQMKQDSKHDAANAYVEGAKCAMKVQPADAVVLLHSAVDLYTDMGRLNMAARQLRDIAEAQEKQGLREEATQFYSQAADLFATENATSDANKCRIKVAELSAEMDKYQVRGWACRGLWVSAALRQMSRRRCALASAAVWTAQVAAAP